MSPRYATAAGCLLLLACQAGLAWQDSEKDKEKDKTAPVPYTGNISGRPKDFKVGGGNHVAVWHDGELWNIFTTGKRGKVASAQHRWGGSVRIEGDTYVGQFGKLEAARKAYNADWIVPHADGRGFDFQFINRGGHDEVKFKLGPNATSMTIKVVLDNRPQPKAILIGRKGENPEKNVFTVPAHPKKK